MLVMIEDCLRPRTSSARFHQSRLGFAVVQMDHHPPADGPAAVSVRPRRWCPLVFQSFRIDLQRNRNDFEEDSSVIMSDYSLIEFLVAWLSLWDKFSGPYASNLNELSSSHHSTLL